MRKFLLKFFFVLLLAFLIGCSTADKNQTSTTAAKTKEEIRQPVNEITQPADQIGAPESKQEISGEVKELLDKSNAKVQSIYYMYKGTETGSNFYEFYIKGTKIKYKPHLEIKTLDKPESYDTIFIDKAAGTAQSYCTAAYCKYKGKKASLDYNNAYIFTIFDWIDVNEAKKVGEEVIDSRSTWKIETNKGILWVDTFYGIPLKIESSGKSYRFQQISVNSLQDSDVTPS